MIGAHKENSNRRVCQTLKPFEAKSFCSFFFLLRSFWALHFSPSAPRPAVVNSRNSRSKSQSTGGLNDLHVVLWSGLDPLLPFSPVPQMVVLLLHKCGTLSCGFTCKLILVVASTADSQACQAYTYTTRSFLHPTHLKLSNMNQQQRPATLILVLLKLGDFFCFHSNPINKLKW